MECASIDKNVVAVDIETDSLRPHDGNIRLVSVADERGSCTYTDPTAIAGLLAEPSITKVFHNSSFDVPWLQLKGFAVQNFTDTMVIAQVLHNQVTQENGLGQLAERYLGKTLDKILQSAENWQSELTPDHHSYAKSDAETTLQLYDVLSWRIRQAGLEPVLHRELRALQAVVRLQEAGILFDFEGWETELDRYACEAEKLEAEIRDQLGKADLNLASPSQLQEALMRIGIEVQSTSEESLARLGDMHTVISSLRRYKKVQKIRSAYGDKLKECAGPDGRIRGNWRLLGANTGRMTCTKPNLQGLPSLAKKYCIAQQGHKVVAADFSQIELRVLAQLSEDPVMIRSFMNDEDLHRKTASMILGKPEEEIDERERKIAKTANFGLIYGMTAYGLQKRIQSMYGFGITLEDAERFRNGYFIAFPGVKKFQDRMLRSTTVQTIGGRSWEASDLKGIQRFNFPVQGTAAEGFKEALALLAEKLSAEWKLIAAVHDEIVLEVPEEQVESASQILRDCMVKGMRNFVDCVPVVVDVIVDDYWAKG